MVYQPAEDSYLLSLVVKKYLSSLKYKKILVLDIGSGSGIQAKTCIKAKIPRKNILCADIDREAVKELEKQGLNSVASDLFSKITGRFDLIIFNPPYLPEDKYDRQIDTTGGKKGHETILKFLKQAKNHLNKNAVILLLVSSFAYPRIIRKYAKNLGYKIRKIAEKKLFFEKLEVWKLSLF